MSYEKTVWQAGDTITAEKLNHIEDGIEAADKPTYSPEAVTGEGDVSIVYNGNQIGVLSESGTLTLDTEGKVVEHDIEIDYAKTPTGMSLPSFTFNTSTEEADPNLTKGIFIVDRGNNTIFTGAFGMGGENADYYIVPEYDNRSGNYLLTIEIDAASDVFNVAVNDAPVAFATDKYKWQYASTTYPGDVTVTVTAKEGGR